MDVEQQMNEWLQAIQPDTTAATISAVNNTVDCLRRGVFDDDIDKCDKVVDAAWRLLDSEQSRGLVYSCAFRLLRAVVERESLGSSERVCEIDRGDGLLAGHVMRVIAREKGGEVVEGVKLVRAVGRYRSLVVFGDAVLRIVRYVADASFAGARSGGLGMERAVLMWESVLELVAVDPESSSRCGLLDCIVRGVVGVKSCIFGIPSIDTLAVPLLIRMCGDASTRGYVIDSGLIPLLLSSLLDCPEESNDMATPYVRHLVSIFGSLLCSWDVIGMMMCDGRGIGHAKTLVDGLISEKVNVRARVLVVICGSIGIRKPGILVGLKGNVYPELHEWELKHSSGRKMKSAKREVYNGRSVPFLVSVEEQVHDAELLRIYLSCGLLDHLLKNYDEDLECGVVEEKVNSTFRDWCAFAASEVLYLAEYYGINVECEVSFRANRAIERETRKRYSMETTDENSETIDINLKQVSIEKVRELVYASNVLVTKDFSEWSWESIFEIVNEHLTREEVFEEVGRGSKFLKRLISFYKPQKAGFVQLRVDKEHLALARTATKVGILLVKSLGSSINGIAVLRDSLIIPSVVVSLEDLHVEESLFTRRRLSRTPVIGYVRMVMALSESVLGLRVLEEYGCIGVLFRVIDSGIEELIVVLIESISISVSGQLRLLVEKALATGTEKVRAAARRKLGEISERTVEDYTMSLWIERVDPCEVEVSGSEVVESDSFVDEGYYSIRTGVEGVFEESTPAGVRQAVAVLQRVCSGIEDDAGADCSREVLRCVRVVCGVLSHGGDSGVVSVDELAEPSVSSLLTAVCTWARDRGEWTIVATVQGVVQSILHSIDASVEGPNGANGANGAINPVAGLVASELQGSANLLGSANVLANAGSVKAGKRGGAESDDTAGTGMSRGTGVAIPPGAPIPPGVPPGVWSGAVAGRAALHCVGALAAVGKGGR